MSGAGAKASVAIQERALKELADQKFALDQHAIVAVTDVQGTITYVNDKFCAISKYSREELLGQNHRILNSSHHPKEFFQKMYHAIAKGKVWHGEIRNRAKDGSIYWVDTTVVPFVGDDGKPRQYIAIRADITERKRAEEARGRLAAIVESSDDAIISKTLDGTITAWNRGAEKLFGYSSAEAVGRSMQMLMPPERGDEEPDILTRIGRGESVEHFETIRARKNGERIDVSVTISPIRDSSGAIFAASNISRDVTERKRAEQTTEGSLATAKGALKELANQKFALDQHAIVAVTDVQGTITYVNDKFCAISKYSKDELIGQNHRILNSGHHSKEFFQEMYHAIAKGKVWHGEIKNRAKDGSIYWVDTTIVPFVGVDGKPRQYVAIRADITERKQVEEALREQAQVLDSAQVFVRDLESRIVSWPRGAEKLYGYKSQEALGRTSHDLFHTRFPEPLQAIEKKLFETGSWEGELIHLRSDGSTIVVSSSWVLHRDGQGRPMRILETNIDITARKQAEAALEAQTLMLQSVLDGMAEGLVAADEYGRFLIWNRAAEKILGHGPAELPSEKWSEHYGCYLPDGVTPFPTEQLPLVRAIQGEQSTTEILIRNPKVAEDAWIEASGSPLRGKDGSTRGGVVAFRDITKRKTDEREIQKLNEGLELRVAERTAQLEALNKELSDQKFALDQHAIVAVTDVQGKITYVNEKFCTISKYSREELVGQDHRMLNPGYHPREFFQQMYHTIANRKVWHGEIKNRAKDGSIFWLDTTIVPTLNAEGKPRQYVAIRADVTKRKQAEERVLQRTAELVTANRELESFTYSVAHDLRAPLRHIAGFSGILVEEFSSSLNAEAQRYLERIQSGTRKMGQLVDELLSLARVGRQEPNLQRAGLNSLVKEVVGILEPELVGRRVEWRIAELPFVECDPTLLKQVFQNLISNAIKYSRPRLQAVIEIGQTEFDGQSAIFVRDNGVGFNMKYADKLFGVFQRLHRDEDFEGTGIGLATVQRIIKKHQGRVWAEAQVDKGATFYFTLGTQQALEVTEEANQTMAVEV
jgi:PAS domain S-box-containing protein